MATRVLIAGRVQGVGFRWATRAEAERLGATGTVRNLPDGRVEVVVDDCPELVEWLRHGPAGADVTGVEVADAAASGESGFRILAG
ncbi:MAG TPA: acylphosphatase [Pseudolysinimonas sp.]|jgi:acylphosphatase|nr:acylphosphatase [Pseudolysinimonas sp.]